MSRTRITAVITASVLGTASSLAWAQTPAAAPAPAPAPAAAPATPIAGGSTLGVSVTEVNAIATGWSAERQLIGKHVYGADDKSIGKVGDLIIAPDSQVSYAIIDVGGFLGIGEHRVAIPVKQFKIDAKDKISLPGATKDALKALPEFVYAKK